MFKFLFLFFAVFSQNVLLASTAINEAELRLFANTQVNDTFTQISGDISAYLRVRGHTRLPEGESSILQAPLPGEEGPLDTTVTLLRFSPMQNQAIAEAQLKLVRSFLAEQIFDGYDDAILNRDGELQSLKDRIVKLFSALKRVQGENEDLLALIKALTATLAELNTKTQQQLEETQKKANATIDRLTRETNDVALVLKTALES